MEKGRGLFPTLPHRTVVVRPEVVMAALSERLKAQGNALAAPYRRRAVSNLRDDPRRRRREENALYSYFCSDLTDEKMLERLPSDMALSQPATKSVAIARQLYVKYEKVCDLMEQEDQQYKAFRKRFFA